jgi:hypothetical protein
MRRDTEFFGETELVLVYMAKRLKHALAVEKIFGESGVDYYLETGPYLSGLLFRTSKVGVFFYTTAQDEQRAIALMADHGFKMDPEPRKWF